MLTEKFKRFLDFFVFLLAPAVILLAPVLFFKKIFLDGDAINYFYPYAYFFQNHYLARWNLYILSGFSVTSSFQFGFFNPVYLLFYRLFNFLNSYHLIILFDLAVAAIFMYLLCRNLNLSHYSALLASAAFAFSQWNFSWLSNLALDNTMMLLPVTFFAIIKIWRGKWLYATLLAAVFGLTWLGAHNQFILITLIADAFFIAYLIWLAYCEKVNFSAILKPILVILFSIILSLFIGWPQLLESMHFANFSIRSGGLGYQAATVDAVSIFDFFRYLLPYFNPPHISGDLLPYVGILPLIFSLVAMIFLVKKNKNTLFFSFLFLFGLIASLKYSPLFWLMSKLPVLNYFRGPARWIFLSNFALAILAGIGFEYLNNSDEAGLVWTKISKFLKKFLGYSTALLILFNIFVLIFGSKIIKILQNIFDRNFYAKTTHLPIDYYHSLIARMFNDTAANLGFLNLKFLFPFVFIFIAYFVIAYFRKNKTLFTRLVIAITALNLVVVAFQGAAFADAYLILQRPVLADFILKREKHPELFRIYSFMPEFTSYQKITALHPGVDLEGFQFMTSALTVNSNIFWGLQSIDGYEPIASERSEQIGAYIGSERTQLSGESLSHQKISLEQKISVLISRKNLLSMLNVKYLIIPYPITDPGFKEVLKTTVTKYNVDLYLYENRVVLPRFYLANNENFISGSESDIFNKVVADNVNFSNTTFIECSSCKNLGKISASDSLILNSFSNGKAELSVKTRYGRWLVFSESNVLGWKAYIDGKSADIYKANYLFQAIYVPQGEHKVIFDYQG
jgi:hypothetical protein